jgi:hypothetical protein
MMNNEKYYCSEAPPNQRIQLTDQPVTPLA